MDRADRRIPINRMIYVADGPSDVPVFSVVKSKGGKAYAVYDPDKEAEFAQNDALLHAGRIHAYGPADYTEKSTTSKWLRMHLSRICDQIVTECETSLVEKIKRAPRHLHNEEEGDTATEALPSMPQKELL
ncbi:MAG: hypothetical protein VYA21_01615 [Verrucomicrobiota bacterium]|nr:hypothetical protein [Verrucomicrobiota bacterium]